MARQYWFQALTRKPVQRPALKSGKRPVSSPLGLEMLEDRLAPASHTWTGTMNGNWSIPANWGVDGAPANGEAGPIVLNFDAATTLAMVDDISGLSVDQMNFTAT